MTRQPTNVPDAAGGDTGAHAGGSNDPLAKPETPESGERPGRAGDSVVSRLMQNDLQPFDGTAT